MEECRKERRRDEIDIRAFLVRHPLATSFDVALELNIGKDSARRLLLGIRAEERHEQSR